MKFHKNTCIPVSAVMAQVNGHEMPSILTKEQNVQGQSSFTVLGSDVIRTRSAFNVRPMLWAEWNRLKTADKAEYGYYEVGAWYRTKGFNNKMSGEVNFQYKAKEFRGTLTVRLEGELDTTVAQRGIFEKAIRLPNDFEEMVSQKEVLEYLENEASNRKGTQAQIYLTILRDLPYEYR